MTTHITRCALALALATGAIASHTDIAAAGTVTLHDDYQGGKLLSFDASPSVANRVSMWAAAGKLYVWDLGDEIEPGAGCDSAGENAVWCPVDIVSSVVVALGDGNDSLSASGLSRPILARGQGGDDDLQGGWANDALYGDDGTDELSGSYGQDSLLGGNGDDVLDGGPGDGEGKPDRKDQLSGGLGRDLADYSDHEIGVTISLDDVRDDGSRDENDRVSSDIEDVLGTTESDTLKGSAAANRLSGNGSKPDALYGYGGNDTLIGSWGADWLDGGTGNDVLPAKDGSDDAILCGPGYDSAAVDPAPLDYNLACEKVT